MSPKGMSLNEVGLRFVNLDTVEEASHQHGLGNRAIAKLFCIHIRDLIADGLSFVKAIPAGDLGSFQGRQG